MEDTQNRLAEMLQRANQFGLDRVKDLPAGTKVGDLFAQLSGLVPKQDDTAAKNISARGKLKSGTDNKAIYFHLIHDALFAIHETARALAAANPTIGDKFHIPHNLTYGNVLAVARAFATDAVPLEADFIACEMSPTFLKDLNTDIDGFAAATDEQSGGKEDRVGSAVGIKSNLAMGLSIVQQLDAIVRNKYRNDAATCAAWAVARHVQRPPKSTKQTTPAPAPTA